MNFKKGIFLVGIAVAFIINGINSSAFLGGFLTPPSGVGLDSSFTTEEEKGQIKAGSYTWQDFEKIFPEAYRNFYQLIRGMNCNQYGGFQVLPFEWKYLTYSKFNTKVPVKGVTAAKAKKTRSVYNKPTFLLVFYEYEGRLWAFKIHANFDVEIISDLENPADLLYEDHITYDFTFAAGDNGWPRERNLKNTSFFGKYSQQIFTRQLANTRAEIRLKALANFAGFDMELLKDPESLVKRIIDISVNDSDKKVQEKAREILSTIKPSVRNKTYIDYLDSTDENTREKSVMNLKRLFPLFKKHDAIIKKLLTMSLNDTSANVKEAIETVLKTINLESVSSETVAIKDRPLQGDETGKEPKIIRRLEIIGPLKALVRELTVKHSL